MRFTGSVPVFGGIALQTQPKQASLSQSRTALQVSASDVATFSKNQPRFGALTTIKIHPRFVHSQQQLLRALNSVVEDGNYQVVLKRNLYHITIPEEYTAALDAALGINRG